MEQGFSGMTDTASIGLVTTEMNQFSQMSIEDENILVDGVAAIVGAKPPEPPSTGSKKRIIETI